MSPRSAPAASDGRLFASRVAAACCVGLALAIAGAPPAAAQEWARKMFETRDHDFGVVARGSDTVFKFPCKNIYKEDVVLGSVRSSCGCTTPTLENEQIKTFETGYVVARFNTRTFTGLHSATLTVSVLKPYPAQVQLRVHGNIRGDVVFEPGSVDFAQVEQGTPREQTLAVTYAGRSGWRIQDVRAASDYLEAELIERSRAGTRATYDLLVRLRDSAPAGYFSEQLVIVTNDAANPRIPLPVSAEVRAAVTAAPAALVMADTPQGGSTTKRLLVRAKKPFRVVGVKCDDANFSFDYDADAESERHLLTVRYTADRKPGRLKEPITVQTSLGPTFTATCDAYAHVLPAAPTSSDPGADAPPADTQSRTAQAR